MCPGQLRDEDLDAFLYSFYEKYGYDFRKYSRAHIIRRIQNRMEVSRMTFHEMQEKALTSREFAGHLLRDFSITVTEMFRDPDFYVAVRQKVIPILKTYSFIRIWHAGCSTGEEVYSMAILLKEEGLLDRTTIYATDFNQNAIEKAREGVLPQSSLKKYTSNYYKGGGKSAFSDYYTCDYELAIISQELKKNIVWGNHNLVTDGIFTEAHMIVCRNVLIYFNKDLQNQVQSLFFKSLANGGILCLGAKENLSFNELGGNYHVLEEKNNIYTKKYENRTD